MLANSFKTPAELKLPFELVECLVAVLGMLEREEIKPKNFDMGEWWLPRTGCGSVGCIGGWTGYVGRLRGYGFRRGAFCTHLHPLRMLLYPNHYPEAWKASPAQAAVALRTYLTTGKVGWKAAMQT